MSVGGVSVWEVAWVASLFLVMRMRPVMSTPSSASSQGEDQHHVISRSVLFFGNSSVSAAGAAKPGTGLEKRERRASGQKWDHPELVSAFSQAEKEILVSTHNAIRRQQGASNMKYMYWDDEVAAFAQYHVERCVFQHSDPKSRASVGFVRSVGENLWKGGRNYDPERVVRAWASEVKHYTFENNACTGVCGHYTQVVWWNSEFLGCGVKFCNGGFMISCNYNPAGNYARTRPFAKGRACSGCKMDSFKCLDNMCAKYPVIGASWSRGPSVPALIGCWAVSAIFSWIAV